MANNQSHGNAVRSLGTQPWAGSAAFSLQGYPASQCLPCVISSMPAPHSVSHTLCALLPRHRPTSSEGRLPNTRLLITPCCSTRGTRDHISFLCYHPLALPAAHNLCRTENMLSTAIGLTSSHSCACGNSEALH